MNIKMIVLFVIVIIFCGIAGYLFYLYHKNKKKQDNNNLNKRGMLLSSILTFEAIGLIGFFISFTKNYLYIFLIVLTIIIGASLILGLLLRIKKSKEGEK